MNERHVTWFKKHKITISASAITAIVTLLISFLFTNVFGFITLPLKNEKTIEKHTDQIKWISDTYMLKSIFDIYEVEQEGNYRVLLIQIEAQNEKLDMLLQDRGLNYKTDTSKKK